MSSKLFLQAIVKYIAGIILVGLLVFVPAGTLLFVRGWIFMGLLFVPMLVMGIVMMIKSPSLLERRLKAKEEQKEQKAVVALSGVLFLSVFVLAGLNYRFSWHILPIWVSLAGGAVFLAGYALYAEVMRDNEYLSRTIEVQENQKVIDTGLYGVVRHPMYMSTVLMFLAIPVILGSVYALLVMMCYIPVILFRIKNEEKVLLDQLQGYEAYRKKVRYRLLPFIW